MGDGKPERRCLIEFALTGLAAEVDRMSTVAALVGTAVGDMLVADRIFKVVVAIGFT